MNDDDELKMLREDIDTLTDVIKYQGDEVVHLREDLDILFDLVNAMSNHVVKLDDTVTRLTLENAKQDKQLQAMTEFERMDAIYRRAAKPDLLQKISELQELVIWMTGCGYDFTQHSYFIEQRNKLVLLEENEDE